MTAPAAYCVGIAGGTGSGKTTLAQAVRDLLGPDMVTVIEADFYYRDLSHLPAQERHRVNFDHPDALDIDLMAAHLQELRCGRSVHMSAYDFTTHCRTNSLRCLLPRPIILIEGILVLACQPIARLLDLKVYIDERPEVRRERRMLRDVRERGRTAGHDFPTICNTTYCRCMNAMLNRAKTALILFWTAATQPIDCCRCCAKPWPSAVTTARLTIKPAPLLMEKYK